MPLVAVNFFLLYNAAGENAQCGSPEEFTLMGWVDTTFFVMWLLSLGPRKFPSLAFCQPIGREKEVTKTN